jgi:cytochrome c oxidase subunit II
MRCTSVAKWWSVLFGAVLLAELLLFVIAPFVGWWLPADVSTTGGEVDALFYLILIMTGIFFVLTEVILVYTMFRYTHDPDRRSTYSHGNHKLEMAWTAVPAVLLVLIAVIQIYTWGKIKYISRMPEPNQVIQITARQWEWRLRVPHEATLEEAGLKDESKRKAWAETARSDDVHTVNAIHTWKGANVKVYLKTQDVIHSFFLPQFRQKQDALPGKTIPLWFNATDSNTEYDEIGKKWTIKAGKEWELACAELCGGSHYRMRGLIWVHETEADYKKWLRQAIKEQNSTEPERRTSEPVALNEK